MSETPIDAIMRIMDAAFDPQWGEAWTRAQVASALQLANTHASLVDAAGNAPLDELRLAGVTFLSVNQIVHDLKRSVHPTA